MATADGRSSSDTMELNFDTPVIDIGDDVSGVQAHDADNDEWVPSISATEDDEFNVIFELDHQIQSADQWRIVTPVPGLTFDGGYLVDQSGDFP